LADTCLQLARVHLHLGEYQEARRLAAQCRRESASSAVAAYVEAEATYSDHTLNQIQRTFKAQNLIQQFAPDSYRPLRELKDAINAEGEGLAGNN
jgi:hypothetical protein